MVTPLYKSLKQNGTTFYAFPGAAEDISAAYQNENYSMNFSKFILLNIPEQNLTSGTANSPLTMDFENSFEKSSVSVAPSFSEQLIESLRNYVANHEVTIRETKIGDNEYFYDNNQLATTTEKVFWKWCKKLNILDLEQAVAQDEYFDNLDVFESNDINDDTYFTEYLWKERETSTHRFVAAYETASLDNPSNLEVEYTGTTNLTTGDKVYFENVGNTNLSFLNGVTLDVLEVIPAGGTAGQRLVFNYEIGATYGGSYQVENTGTSNLVYDRLVQYIGEITAINNVQEANRSYTEVYAHIGDHLGQTPDILFRTIADDNYKPNLEFPVLPSQYQPEIFGAENFSSPIVNNPSAYPGDYFGQFDDPSFIYKTSSGDSLRRSGEYYGVFGDTNETIFDSTEIDGLNVDFDTTHYVKMNIINREVSSFDEFNALDINNEPPVDFEFNAILWYYTVTDVQGNEATNLYGITVLDHPDNNPNPELAGVKIPTYKKLVNDGTKDGTSYAFSLNLNFNIIDDNVQPSFNPGNINSLFSFNLFNESMTRLASANDSFNQVLAENNLLKQELSNIKQLLYTQTDLTTINNRISNVEELLKLYETLQLVSTDTVEVSTNLSQSPPVIELNSVDSIYVQVDNVKVTDLYSSTGIIPYNVSVPQNKNFMVRVANDDETNFELPNDDRLTVVLDRDLDYKQGVDIIIDGDDNSTENKKLDIYITYNDGSANAIPTETLLIGNIDLPVYFNDNLQTTNSAFNWEQTKFKVDLSGTNPIKFDTGNILQLPLESNIGVNKGDTFLLNNLVIGATLSTDYSAQYLVESVATASNYINIDISSNQELVDYVDTLTSLPYTLHGTASSDLGAQPFLSFNKGYKFTVTRVDDNDTSTLSERYYISGGLV
jgi:hypothetical protein